MAATSFLTLENVPWADEMPLSVFAEERDVWTSLGETEGSVIS